MRARRIVSCLLCAVLALPVHAGGDGRGATLGRLHFMEAWRLAPEAVLNVCRETDPAGDADRQRTFRNWSVVHADLRARIERRFDTLAPMLHVPATSRGEAISAERATVVMALLQTEFAGMGPRQVLEHCRAYATSAFPLWSRDRTGRVRAALEALENT